MIRGSGGATYLGDTLWPHVLNSGGFPRTSELSLSDVLLLRPKSDEGIDYHDIYVARELSVLLDLVRLHATRTLHGRRADRELGKVLGYPLCCINNYVALGPMKAWHEHWKKLVVSGLDQRMPVELWAVYHAPCFPTCKETLRLGAEYLEAVERFSEELRLKVESRLSCAHLAFSIGRRHIDFLEGETINVRPEVRDKASELLQEPIHIVVGRVLRPFSFFVWEGGRFKIHLTPEIMGRKYIAFSPGNGVLVMGDNLETYIYFRKEALSENYAAYASTAFRVYRCSKR